MELVERSERGLDKVEVLNAYMMDEPRLQRRPSLGPPGPQLHVHGRTESFVQLVHFAHLHANNDFAYGQWMDTWMQTLFLKFDFCVWHRLTTRPGGPS